MTERLTEISDASEAEVDMQVNMSKTFTAQKREDQSHRSRGEEGRGEFKCKCDFCPRRIKTQKTMYLHRSSCIYNYDTTEKSI